MRVLSEILNNSKLSNEIKNILAEDIFGVTKEKAIRERNLKVPTLRYLKFKRMEKEILRGLPYQYLVGKAFFYKSTFFVTKNVLCPRPETEIMVEAAAKIINSKKKNRAINIIDIGTGSGCIIVSLAKELSKKASCLFYACDISLDALKVARKNARLHKADVKFYKSDLFSCKNLPGKFDIILANLPYLPNNMLRQNKDLKHEPAVALFGGGDGLDIVYRMLEYLPCRLEREGLALIEIHPGQEKNILKKCESIGLSGKTLLDLNHRARIILIERTN